MERYDGASEAARGAEQLDRRERIRRRRLSILFAPLVGLLPGETQKRMEGEFGAPAVAMTIASALPLAVAGFLGLFGHLLGSVGGGLGLPEVLTPPFPVAIYLCMESALRLASAVAAGEPMALADPHTDWPGREFAARSPRALRCTGSLRRAHAPDSPSRRNPFRRSALVCDWPFPATSLRSSS